MENDQISNSILLSVKKLLGYPPELLEFDIDIMIHINSAIQALLQIGVGNDPNFSVTGSEETYSDFLGEKTRKQEMVKTYLFLKVKIGFDPPSSSSLLESYKQMAKELEWRMQIQEEVIEPLLETSDTT